MTTGRRPTFDPDDLGASAAQTDDFAPIGRSIAEAMDDEETPREAMSTGERRRQEFARGSGRDLDAIESGHRTGPQPRLDSADLAPIGGPPDDFAGWEWARRCDARMTRIEAEAQAARDDAEAARRVAADAQRENAGARKIIRRGVQVITGGLGAILVGVGAAWKLAVASGDATGTAREREADRIEVRALVHDHRDRALPEIRASIALNAAAIAGLRGSLDMINRLGAVRVLGPQPQPLLDGDPP